MEKLTSSEIKQRLSHLDGWVVVEGALKKEFKFKDFVAAMEFMNALMPVAEKLDHHPDWFNSYNKVLICLTSHSEGGLTSKDFEFAAAAEKRWSEY